MEGLYESVIKGNYQPIPSSYSKELAGVIRLMLQQNPTSRPTTDKLLKSSLILKKSQLKFRPKIRSRTSPPFPLTAIKPSETCLQVSSTDLGQEPLSPYVSFNLTLYI